MNRMAWKAFVRRRLSPEEYLGLHLTCGLLLCAALLGLFAWVAHGAIGQGRVEHFDTELGESLAEHRKSHDWVRDFFFGVTQLGAPETITGLALAIALMLIVRRHRLLALVWLVALAGCGLLDAGLKLVFQRERPDFRDPGILETTASFPSGHAMGSFLCYGLIAYLILLGLPLGTKWRYVAVAFALLVVLIGSSRIYLGAHYFSDVVGGYLIGSAWLATCITAVETVRRRRSVTARLPRST